ncbi:hypothetical protein L208DRAFT_1449250 [Tricholoma matsutake]|nr:hypothetical protein L208DRAFT_1449250 [Tricholoma matsutake 945]
MSFLSFCFVCFDGSVGKCEFPFDLAMHVLRACVARGGVHVRCYQRTHLRCQGIAVYVGAVLICVRNVHLSTSRWWKC